MNIGIVGVTGYSGMVLYSFLINHSEVDHIYLYGNQQNEQPRRLTDEVPAFGMSEQMIYPFDSKKVMEQVDCLFFATPSGIASQLADEFIQCGFPVIDLSGDYRLSSSEEYDTWYGQPNRTLPDAAKVTYGLSEFTKSYATYVANPGCYATAALLALAPLAIEGWLDPTSIIIDAKSGVSGSGKKLAPTSQFTFINENAWVYKLNQHQHIPEMVQQLQQWDQAIEAIQFSTTLLPITRGLIANQYVRLKKQVTQEELNQLYQSYYQASQFVRFKEQHLPTIKEVTGSNFCDIGLVMNEATQVVTIVSVIDNLVKGAAGQAVQNFNKLFGFEESTGLPLLPQFP